jgi:RND family efflux transporter MFP subunit
MNRIFGKNINTSSPNWLIIGISIALALAILGIGLRIYNYFSLHHETKEQAVPTVTIMQAQPGPGTEEIVLPANVQAWHETTIYARVNGYVVNWLVDIGSRVKQNDLLATISAPEVDAQLRQTEADLKTAKANYHLAVITAERWKKLVETESVSEQETDEKVCDEAAKAAIVAATRANRDRLKDLVRFEKILAPFDGIIALRNTDIGNLINAGSSITSVPLFRIVQSNRLRVYINIPQYYSGNIIRGLTTQLYFMEYPRKVFLAKLLDSANAIDPTTRTLLVQFVIDNSDYLLKPGSYTEVHLRFSVNKNNVRLPVNALIFRAQGTQIATIDNQSRVVLKPIMIGRNFGDYIEILSGVNPGDKIIINPPDSVFGGEKVKVVKTQPPTKPNGQSS